eukprot:6717925-Pyramimonas_sp.AAC.1
MHQRRGVILRQHLPGLHPGGSGRRRFEVRCGGEGGGGGGGAQSLGEQVILVGLQIVQAAAGTAGENPICGGQAHAHVL